MNLSNCHNFNDFRKLAKKKLPSPIFHYIDGGSDDEVTLNRNTEAFNDYDLVPNVLSRCWKYQIYRRLFLEKKLIYQLFLSAYSNAIDFIIMKVIESFSTSWRKIWNFVIACLQWLILQY